MSENLPDESRETIDLSESTLPMSSETIGPTPSADDSDNTLLLEPVEQGLTMMGPDSQAVFMPDKKRGWKKPVIAGTALLAVLLGGIGVGINLMGGNETKADTSTSTPLDPHENISISTSTPEELVGVGVNNYLEQINIPPTPEIGSTSVGTSYPRGISYSRTCDRQIRRHF